MEHTKKKPSLKEQVEDLRTRLSEAEANLEAIRSGAADAIVVHTDTGISVFTIQGAEAAYRIMVETMNEGAVTVDNTGVMLYVNTRMCNILGHHCSNLVGKHIQNMLSENCKDDFELFLKKTVSGGSCHQDFEFVRRDLSVVPVYLSSAPLEIIGRHDICIVVSDLTERKVVQQKLINLNNTLEEKIKQRTKELEKLTSSLEQQVSFRTAQVRDLAKELTLAEQKQRHRLSVILHEDLQQTLFSIKTRFNLLRDTLKGVESEDINADIKELETLTVKALDTTKRLAVEFNPPVLQNEGLDASLRWLAHHMHKTYGLNAYIDIADGFVMVREEERTLIVNLIRELLYNVVQHAETGKAFVSVNQDGSHIFISVEDKGVGFDIEKERTVARGKTHMGLISIEERLHLFGGTFQVQSIVGKGTKITMKLPFDPEKRQLGVE
jgi:PAS domain S-box-containing protein